MGEHCFGRGGTGQVTTMPAGTAPVGREAAEVASSAGYPEIVAGLPRERRQRQCAAWHACRVCEAAATAPVPAPVR
jgi:hypothetical protein